MRRRTLLLGVLGGSVGTASARSLDGWKEELKTTRLRLSNLTVVGADGDVEDNWGAEITNGVVRVSPDIRDGLDMSGHWLAPGFVDAGCRVGLFEVALEKGTRDDSEDNGFIQPTTRAYDGYNALSEVVPTVRANGITSIVVHPNINRLVPGLATAFTTVGSYRKDALIRVDSIFPETVGLCLALGRRGKGAGGPSSRMGIASELRGIFDEFKPTPPEEEGLFKKDKPVPVDDSLEGNIWRSIRDKSIPLLIWADRVDDIMMALELKEEHDIDVVLVSCAEGWMVAREIADAEVPILLGPTTVQPDSFEHLHARPDNPKLLYEAGVFFAFRSGYNHRSRTLPAMTALAVAHGLPWKAAIEALCRNAYDILRLKRLPMLLKEGYQADADVILCSGDPLLPSTRIERCWVGGREVDLRSKQTDLYHQYKERY